MLMSLPLLLPLYSYSAKSAVYDGVLSDSFLVVLLQLQDTRKNCYLHQAYSQT
jgi:hypothetical protein